MVRGVWVQISEALIELACVSIDIVNCGGLNEMALIIMDIWIFVSQLVVLFGWVRRHGLARGSLSLGEGSEVSGHSHFTLFRFSTCGLRCEFPTSCSCLHGYFLPCIPTVMVIDSHSPGTANSNKCFLLEVVMVMEFYRSNRKVINVSINWMNISWVTSICGTKISILLRVLSRSVQL